MIKDIFNNNVKYKNNKTNYINKIILVPCSSGFKHSIQEILENNAIGNKINDVKAIEEVK